MALMHHTHYKVNATGTKEREEIKKGCKMLKQLCRIASKRNMRIRTWQGSNALCFGNSVPRKVEYIVNNYDTASRCKNNAGHEWGAHTHLSGELLLLKPASISALETFFYCVLPHYLIPVPLPSQMRPTYFDKPIPAVTKALIQRDMTL